MDSPNLININDLILVLPGQAIPAIGITVYSGLLDYPPAVSTRDPATAAIYIVIETSLPGAALNHSPPEALTRVFQVVDPAISKADYIHQSTSCIQEGEAQVEAEAAPVPTPVVTTAASAAPVATAYYGATATNIARNVAGATATSAGVTTDVASATATAGESTAVDDDTAAAAAASTTATTGIAADPAGTTTATTASGVAGATTISAATTVAASAATATGPVDGIAWAIGSALSEVVLQACAYCSNGLSVKAKGYVAACCMRIGQSAATGVTVG